MRVGQNIRKWRDLKGIKQKDLAHMLGIKPPELSKIENDKAKLTL